MATPLAFLPVMGSPTKKKAKIMVNTGPSVPMMAQSMDVAMVMPTRKDVWVRNSPRKEARAIFHRSPFCTFSLGRKSDNSQNMAVAPMARKVNSTKGFTAWELAMSLHSTTFKPNMVYAAAMDKCPFS